MLILSNMDLQVSEYSSFDELESLCAVVVVVVFVVVVVVVTPFMGKHNFIGNMKSATSLTQVTVVSNAGVPPHLSVTIDDVSVNTTSHRE